MRILCFARYKKYRSALLNYLDSFFRCLESFSSSDSTRCFLSVNATSFLCYVINSAVVSLLKLLRTKRRMRNSLRNARLYCIERENKLCNKTINKKWTNKMVHHHDENSCLIIFTFLHNIFTAAGFSLMPCGVVKLIFTSRQRPRSMNRCSLSREIVFDEMKLFRCIVG